MPKNAYLTSLQSNPGYPYAWEALGDLYEKQGDRVRAEDAYRKAIEYEPDTSSAWTSLLRLLVADPKRGDDAFKTANEYLRQTNRSAESLAAVAWELMVGWPRYA